MAVRQRTGSVSLIGPRSVNEDSLHLSDHSWSAGRVSALLAVADGMGGLSSGDVASATAIQVVTEQVPEVVEAENLVARVTAANDRIQQLAVNGDGATMGTTLTTAVVVDTQATVVHIGDSRAYLVHGEQITQITEDHSRVGRLVREGVLSDAEAMHHPEQNVLERALGAGDSTPDVYRVGLGAGDVLFLCTDGLHTYVTADEMRVELQQNVSLQAACERLARLAEERGSQDNITAVAWEYPLSAAEDGSVADTGSALSSTVVRAQDAPGGPPSESSVRLPVLLAGLVGMCAGGFVIGLALSLVTG